MGTITKREISENIARKLGLKPAAVQEVVKELMKQVTSALAAGHKLEFRNFGIFEVLRRKGRLARNPRTGERVQVPAKRKVTFRMGRLMRDRLGS